MHEKENGRFHHFEFPAGSGSLSIRLNENCLPDVEEDELYSIGKLVSDLLYGFLLEKREMRDNYLNIFQSVLKDVSLSVEDKDIPNLLRYSNKAFHDGDYENSLFLSKLVLSKINKIIDKKIAHNDRTIDKEVIHLQISTLNFIGYLFSKMRKNVDYGLKLTNIANTLLNEFNEENDETIQLRSAILDTLGALYILKKDWENAIRNLTSAHEFDSLLISRGKTDEIGYRLTCSNLGYALVQKCNELLDADSPADGQAVKIGQIEDDLGKAKNFFLMVEVDKPPAVPEGQLKELELLAALKRMKKGLTMCEEVRKKLQKRLI
jgi:hypothetical protein